MGKGSLLSMVAIAGTLALGFAGHELRKRQDAADLAARAMHLLHADAADAPDLTHVQAQQARSLLDDALRIHDGDALRGLRHLASALAYLQKGELERAADRTARAEALTGVTADTAFLRAAIAHENGELPKAQQAVSQALRLGTRHTRAQLLQADLQLLRGEPEAALSTLTALSDAEGPAATVENRRGVALEALDRTDEAREAFRRATALDGRLYQGHLNLARALRADGETAAALASFLEAAKRAPSDSAPQVGMGLCRLSMGDFEGAEADLERAATLVGGQDATLLLAMGDLSLARRDLIMAAEHYEAAILAAPDHPLARLKQGNTFMLLGRRVDAADAFRAAVALDPKLSAAHNGLGAALLSLGETEAAAVALQTAAELDPNDPNPLLNLARLHRSLGDETQAKAALRAAQERDPAVKLASL